MMGCCSTACGIGGFFSRFSRRYRRRYERRGLEPTQKQLVEGLNLIGLKGRTLIEIGCGVGYLHQHLLLAGASSAVGIDLSPAMLEEAQALAARQGLSARTRYVQGDFRDIASGLEQADVTLLDKVICCYPDAYGLLVATLQHTKEVCGFTLPRDRAVTRLGARVAAFVFRVLGSTYRPFVHDPHAIDAQMRAAGFRKVSEAQTVIWLTRIYRRSGEDALLG